MGHLAPVTLIAKTFMQDLWRTTKSWDEEVTKEFREKWLNFWEGVKLIHQVKVSRWSGFAKNVKIELHGFADASEKGYGAVIYVRAESRNGNITVTQLTAKSKVAPLKVIAIPQLELSATALLSKMIKHVRENMEWENIPYYLRTDSTITLQWLQKEPCELKMFVGNRISDIQKDTDIACWSHVKSADNPADLASRGLMPNEISKNNL